MVGLHFSISFWCTGLRLQIGPVINRGKHRLSVGIRTGWSRARAGIQRLLASSGASLEEHRVRKCGEGAVDGKITPVDRQAWVEVPHGPGRPHTGVDNWRAMGSMGNDWQACQLRGSFPGMGRAGTEKSSQGRA